MQTTTRLCQYWEASESLLKIMDSNYTRVRKTMPGRATIFSPNAALGAACTCFWCDMWSEACIETQGTSCSRYKKKHVLYLQVTCIGPWRPQNVMWVLVKLPSAALHTTQRVLTSLGGKWDLIKKTEKMEPQVDGHGASESAQLHSGHTGGRFSACWFRLLTSTKQVSCTQRATGSSLPNFTFIRRGFAWCC